MIALVWLMGLADFAWGQVCLPEPTGLVGWWPYEETNPLVAMDVVGVSHAALMTNGITIAAVTDAGTMVVPGKVGLARRLSRGEYLSSSGAGNLNITKQVTIEAWLKLVNNPDNAQRFTAQIGKLGFPDRQAYQIAFESGSHVGLPPNQWLFEYILTRSDGFRAHNQSTGVILTVDGAFHHVAMTYDGVTVRLYLDGVLRGSSAFAGNLINVPAEPFAASGMVPFELDELGVYARALSDSEIQAIVGAGSAGKCAPPILNIDSLPGAVRLTWSTNASIYLLETNSTLTFPAGWGLLTSNYSVLNTNFAVTNTVGGAPQFYRLRRP